MRQLFARLLEILAELVDFEHLSIPLLLQELEHAREAHRAQGFGRDVVGYFEVNQVSRSV